MKKTIVLILTLAMLLCSLTGCMFDRTFSFLQPTSEISSIKIVSLNYGDKYTDGVEESVICEIDNIPMFLKDFMAMDFSRKSPPYRHSPPTPTLIKFTYNNGEFEAVAPTARLVGNRFSGSVDFDEDDFNDLIRKYVGEEQQKLEYNFYEKKEEIKSIELVRVGNRRDYNWYPAKPKVLCEIADHEGFLKDLAEVDCFFSCYPAEVIHTSVAIRIIYEGEYERCELIGAAGQSKMYGLEMIGYLNHGYRTFDTAQFNALIEKYLGIYEEETGSSDTYEEETGSSDTEESTSDTEDFTSDTEETVSDTTDTSLS